MKKPTEAELLRTKEYPLDTLRNHVKFLEMFLEIVPSMYSTRRSELERMIEQYRMVVIFLEAAQKAFEAGSRLGNLGEDETD